MKRILLLLMFLVPALVLSPWLIADGGKQTRALDLPSGKVANSDEDEDSPESIMFYGQEYEGDALFWCLAAFDF